MIQSTYKFAFIYAIIFIFGFHSATTEDIECPDLSIIGRESWGPVHKVSKAAKILNPHITVNIVVIHLTATNSCKTQDDCKQIIKEREKLDLEVMGKSDILMHFFIGSENMVFEGRGWAVEDEAIPHYQHAFNIAFIGNYTAEANINPKSVYVAQNLIQCGVKMKQISKDHKVFGHRDLRCTPCPGEKLYSLIQKWPKFNRDSTVLKPPCIDNLD